MAQFKIEKKIEIGKIQLANYDEIKTELINILDNYKEFKVSNETYADAKSKRAELNNFDKSLKRIRIDTKKEFLAPYEMFESQIKYLTSLVSDTASEIDKGIKEIDERQTNAKRLDIELYFRELKMLIPLDKVYKKEWENKSYSLENIQDEILQLKAQIDKDLNYITNHVANNDILLKARIKATYLDTLDLISSIEKETEKANQVNDIAKQEINDEDLEVKDIEILLTVNSKQWYQIQNFVKSIGAKMLKIKGEK
jgi:hypothetical protein